MAYKTKFDGSTDKTIKLGGAGNPTSIEGYFLGSKDTQSDFGPGKLHIFQTAEGSVGVWGKTRMNSLLTDEIKGQMVLLTFTGMVAPSKKGRQPSYGYKLQHDPDNTVDVSGVNVNAETAAEESEEDYVEETTGNEESYEAAPPARPVAPVRAAAVPDAARKAQVQALLNKNRTRT